MSRRLLLSLATVFFLFSFTQNSSAGPSDVAEQVEVLDCQGRLELSADGGQGWTNIFAGQRLHAGDSLRVGSRSRATLRWPGQSVIQIGPDSEVLIRAVDEKNADSGLRLQRGAISFFHRGEPGRIEILTHGTVAGVEGTEFLLTTDEADKATMSVVDGRVRFGNSLGALLLTNGQQAVAVPGAAPTLAPGFIVNNLLQWCFYYPAVLDLDELHFSDSAKAALADALDAYRQGDLPAALGKIPEGKNVSDREKIFVAALLLSVGEVVGAEHMLASVGETSGEIAETVGALRRLIAAVKLQAPIQTSAPQTASGFLADSYFQQSRARDKSALQAALESAQAAARLAPQNGFAWERVAELEFSFGRIDAAQTALEKSLVLAPRNAQALALKGFLASARKEIPIARNYFDQAIQLNPALGNAWLGRGLTKFSSGDEAGGKADLLIAAAKEPQRSLLRSYLAKAFIESGDDARSEKELALAERLDPNDPTPWLYAALFYQRQNRINEAVTDLEKSKELNGNRRVYRSQLLLDHDQAVRSANLARVYQDAGMEDVGLREAASAINGDYGNYAAHYFLAGSLHQQINSGGRTLRYETPAAIEYSVADLLAPARESTMGFNVSQSEYSRLFDADGTGFASTTEYLSRGAWSEGAGFFGSYKNFGYDVETHQHWDPGQRRNNDFEQHVFFLKLKGDISAKDSLLFELQHVEMEGGDLTQYYDQRSANTGYHFKEDQRPNLSLGWHREWSPSDHTLFLISRWDSSFSFTNFVEPTYLMLRPDLTPGVPTTTLITPMASTDHFAKHYELYSGELQHIRERGDHTTILGMRLQEGISDVNAYQINPWGAELWFPNPPAISSSQRIEDHFERLSFYGYHHWRILNDLQLIGGLAWDKMIYPINNNITPVTPGEQTAMELSPKLGLIWTPRDDTTLRFAYTRSLGGADLDQSQQIEPSQVAGFIQTYRDIIPESIVGGTAGARNETFNLSLEKKFSTRTYVALTGEILNCSVNRMDGAFAGLPDEFDWAIPYYLRERLKYQEKSAELSVNQLLGKRWSLAASYRISQAVLDDYFPDVVPSLLLFNQSIEPHLHYEGLLHRVGLSAVCNLPTGFFSQGQFFYFTQENTGFGAAQRGDNNVQLNLYVGYRSPNRHWEVRLGLLNLTDQDYHLNPLNAYSEMPHGRTLSVRLQLNF